QPAGPAVHVGEHGARGDGALETVGHVVSPQLLGERSPPRLVAVNLDQYSQHMAEDWISANEALARLGVRPQTLYAYVSRGRVRMRPDPLDPRRSLYRAGDVDGLRQRKARSRKPAEVARAAIAWGEPVLPSAITTVVDGRLYYRGRDAVELSKVRTWEGVARLLRGGEGLPQQHLERPQPPAGRDPTARAFLALAGRAAVAPPAQAMSAAALASEAASLLD